MLIRAEQPGDIAAIRAVHEASFPSALEANLVDALRDARRLSVSYVAEIENQVAGHIAFSPVTTAAGHVGVGLAPVAVLPTYRRLGIAAALITAGLAAPAQLGFGWAVVLGDPAYYGRFGFRAAAEFGLCDEYDGGPAFQSLELRPEALPLGAGLVRYAPEFATFST
jgi:putative acetyltransferase